MHPIIEIIDDNIAIDGKQFKRHELRELKLYLQQCGVTEALFYPEDDDQANRLEEIVIEMRDLNPDIADDNNISYYEN